MLVCSVTKDAILLFKVSIPSGPLHLLAPTVTRSKVQLQRITDDRLVQDMFAKRKQSLVKKAMELSVLCDCDVGLIIFGPGSSGPGTGGQRLYQYSSISMDELLERYAAAVAEPHERRSNGELLRHYYELSPDDDGEEAAGRNSIGGASTSAAAAAAAATMAVVDSIILGGGGRRLEGREGITGLLKRMRMNSPGLDGVRAHGDHTGAIGGALRPLLSGSGPSAVPGVPNGPAGMISNSQGSLVPPGAGAPLRRLGAPSIPLEGIKAAGFLDKRNYPVSPRSEKAYEEITAEIDKLTEMRSQRAGNSGRQNTPTVLQPLSSSHASQQQHLQQIIHQQQLLQRQQQQQQQQQQGGGAKRFKPLSILVPELQTHPIIATNLTPLQSAPGAAAAGPSAVADGSTSAAGRSCEALHSASNGPEPHGGLMQQQQQSHPTSQFNSRLQQHPPQQQQHNQQQQGALPPRPPAGCPRPPSTQSQGSLALGVGTGGLHNGRGVPGSTPSPPRPMAISPTTSAVGPGETGALAAPMEVDGGGANGSSAGPFVLDRRGGALGDDGLASLLGASAFRTSLDGSAANLLTLPSPPPHSAANALFGSLDGGPLSMRSGSHGMLGSLSSLDRGASLGLGGLAMSLESPGGHVGLETTLRGLAPMDVLDWPSISPRSSTGNGDAPAGSGDFPDDGEGGTVLDGLVVRGTALSKLAPGALEAAIGPSPDTCGGGSGTPVSTRARVSLSAFSGHTATTSTTTPGQQPDVAPAPGSFPGSAETQLAVQPGALSSHGSVSSGRGGGAGVRVGQDADGEGLSGGRRPGADAGVGAPHGRCEVAGNVAKPSGEVGSDREGERAASLVVAGSLGLTPELSLNDMCLGRIDTAAAAAVTAVHVHEGKGISEGHGAAAEGLLGLEVVGKALVLPSGARTNAVQGDGAAQGTAGG